VANYVEPSLDPERTAGSFGVRAIDRRSGREAEVGATVTVNAQTARSIRRGRSWAITAAHPSQGDEPA